MPFHSECDDSQQRVTLVAEGAITVDAWAAAAAQILLDRVWHYGTLYDFTAPDAAIPSAAEMATLTPVLGELVQQEGSRGPVAFAVARDDDHARIEEWIARAGRHVLRLVRVFRTRAEADHWLEAVLAVQRRQA